MIGRTYYANYIALIIVGIFLALLPIGVKGNPYYLRLATIMLAYMCYVVAFNIIFGHTGQLFLSTGALAGSSAYLSVIMTKELGIPPFVTIPFGVLCSATIGSIFSYVSVRRGLGVIFVGMITLVFSFVYYNLILGLRVLTHGEDGLVTKGLGLSIFENRWSSYYIFLAILLLSLLLYHFIMTSRIGLAFRSLRDDELTAELSGIDVTRYKVLAAFIGSAILGIVGSFYTYYNGFINPDVFSFVRVDVLVLVMLLFGGMATLLGPIFGGAVFTMVHEVVRPLGALSLLVYGIILVVLFLAFREGLIMTLRKITKLYIP